MKVTATDLEKAADIISSADALVIGAGAGIGIDSGLPDFRGNNGFWNAYPALARTGINFVEIASPRTFTQDLKLAWGFYGHRLNLYRQTKPHAGFGLLRQWAESKPLGGWVYTSNVDGQFQKAGFDSESIKECHGSIHHLQCFESCSDDIWSASGFVPEVDDDNCHLVNTPPVCPKCGSLARPNILMFGDWGWIHNRAALQAVNQNRWLEKIDMTGAKLAVIEIGAGTAIPSVRHFSQTMIQQYEASLVRINIRESEVPRKSDVGLAMGALEALTRIGQFIG